MFRTPQIVLFSRDVEGLASFYKSLGFSETFRVPTDSQPIHIDVALDGYTIGIASIESTRDDHDLQPHVVTFFQHCMAINGRLRPPLSVAARSVIPGNRD